MRRKKLAGLILVLVLLIGVGYVVLVWLEQTKPGAYLEGTIRIQYQDGASITVGSEDRQIFNVLSLLQKRLAVLTHQGEKVWAISTDVNIRFNIDPPDAHLKCQYWVLYWIELEGPFFSGTRAYHSWTGFVDTPNPLVSPDQYQASRNMNKWQAKVGNPEIGWFTIKSFVEPFYQEATSSVWVDLSTYISDPNSVTDALEGLPMVGSLADKLGAHLSAADVYHGYKPLVVSWEMTGPDFYIRLKRSNFGGFSIHLGDFSVGGGEFARMHENDQYRVTFKVGYFFRWQDISTEWTDWKSGTVTIASLDMNISEGSWCVVDAEIPGEAVRINP